MAHPVRLLPLGAALLYVSAFAGESVPPVQESAAVRAAQARLDAAAKELADIMAREHPGSSSPMKIELRVTQEGEPPLSPGSPSEDARIERRIALVSPDGIHGGDPHPMVQVFKRGMHGPLPDAPSLRGVFPDTQLVTLSPVLGKYFGISSGVLIVHAGHAAGLQDGDVLTQIGQRRVDNAERARGILDTYGPGEPVPMTVHRDRQVLELTVPVESPRVPSDR